MSDCLGLDVAVCQDRFRTTKNVSVQVALFLGRAEGQQLHFVKHVNIYFPVQCMEYLILAGLRNIWRYLEIKD